MADLTEHAILEILKKDANDPSLTKIDIKYQCTDADYIRQLCGYLEQNTTVTALLLSGNDLSQEDDDGVMSAKYLAKLLKKNQHIVQLDLSFCDLTDDGAKYLRDALKHRKAKLEVLELTGNDIKDSLMKAMAAFGSTSSVESEPNSPPPSATMHTRVGEESVPDEEIDSATLNTALKSLGALRNHNESRRHTISAKSLLEKEEEENRSREHEQAPKSHKMHKSSRKPIMSPREKRTRTSSREKTSPKRESKTRELEAKVRQLEQMVALQREQIAHLQVSASKALQRVGEGKKSIFSKGTKDVFSLNKLTMKKTINLKDIVVHDILATGGSGAIVYNCTVSGWGCCMKELDLKNTNIKMQEAFLSEMEILENLPPSPNLCKYLFHIKKKHKLQIFMTRYSASFRMTLDERQELIAQGRQEMFKPSDIATMCLDILCGLTILHKNKIIHRDLKSANILVTYDSHKTIKRLAISDFDAAKKIGKKIKAKTVLGTPNWMAPEVLKASQDGAYTFAVDIWSFGMVLYEMLTLNVPYKNVEVIDLTAHILKGKRPEFPEDFSKSFDVLRAVFNMCTELNPSKRPTPRKLV